MLSGLGRLPVDQEVGEEGFRTCRLQPQRGSSVAKIEPAQQPDPKRRGPCWDAARVPHRSFPRRYLWPIHDPDSGRSLGRASI